MRKGIILAGGSGTRLHPLTLVVSKQLLPVYEKPMIYYPLSTLMLAGIRQILVISTPADLPHFQRLLGDGSRWGLQLEYAVQPSPDGLAQAFIIARDFIGNDPCCLILGDNIFYGSLLAEMLLRSSRSEEGATIFAYPVSNPSRYGVLEFDKQNKPVSIEEKPNFPKSRYAVTGLYFYDNNVGDITSNLTPSKRGELEISDVNTWYLERSSLTVERMGRGMAWFDAGTHDSLLAAATFIETVEKRQGLKVGCPEEISFDMGFIDAAQLLQLAEKMKHTAYGRYLYELVVEQQASCVDDKTKGEVL